MSERTVVDATEVPLTASAVTAQLRACGLAEGQVVLVHLSLSRLGWVAGGAEAVIQALLAAVGPDGTILMPAHSNHNTEPSEWRHPPVPASWWPVIRAHTPAYDPRTTPTRGLGAVPELFRTWPGAVRSGHPVLSLAALGPRADDLLAEHDLEDEVGDRSPLGRLYALDGHVLLLGVGHANNSSLHLAEARARYAGKRNARRGSAMWVDGARRWVTYETLDTNADDFAIIGAAFDEAQGVLARRVGLAEARFFRQRPLVDFGVAWMEEHR